MAASLLLLQSGRVQTILASWGATFLSKQLNARIEIQQINIQYYPEQSILLKGLHVETPAADSLAHIGNLNIKIGNISFSDTLKINVESVKLDSVFFALKKDSSGTSNLAFLINYFSNGEKKPKDTTKKSKPIFLSVDTLSLSDATFILKNDNNIQVTAGMNYTNLRVSDINIQAHTISIAPNGTIAANINHLGANEQCGFKLRHLGTNAVMTDTSIVLQDLSIITPTSKVGNYFAFHYDHISDFANYVDKMFMDTRLENSFLDFQDIAYFAPALKPFTLKLRIDGKASGRVPHLTGKKLRVKTAQHTEIDADVELIGLPNANNTIVDFNFRKLKTNAPEINAILKSINQGDIKLPTMLNHLEIVEYIGTYKGYFTNFIVDGNWHSPIGHLTTNVKMDFKTGPTTKYQGDIEAKDFNIGTLLDVPSLGKTTLNWNVEGVGFNEKALNINSNLHCEYLDFNNYNYHDVTFNLTGEQGVYGASLISKDENFDNEAAVTLDLSTEEPQWNIHLDINHIDFKELNFVQDTLLLKGEILTQITGHNRHDAVGIFTADSIVLKTSKGTANIDSLTARVSKTASGRIAELHSDILHFKLEGEFDVLQLTNATKQIVHHYLPSFRWTQKAEINNQNFSFEAQLKNITPLTSIFLPDLNLVENGKLSGNFDSYDSQNTHVNISIGLFNYKNIRLNNFALEQTVQDSAFILNFSINEYSIDSLTFRNIAMENRIENDLITSNFQSEDNKAVNAINLNTQVAFSGDSILLSVLPSNLVLNKQTWSLNDRFKILFSPNAIDIEYFTLTLGMQKLALEGSIAKDDSNPLIVTFRNFDLTFFNPLLEQHGINLMGTLTGNASIASILAKPKVSSDFLIQNLGVNGQVIGDAEINTRWYSLTNTISLNMNVTKDILPLISLNGSVFLDKEEDNLEAVLTVNKTNLNIIQPFVTGLVSNIQGTFNADMQISGSVLKPEIDGFIGFNNSSLKINYLGTNYTLTNKLGIKNSKVSFEDFTLLDARQNKAVFTSDSYVDLADLKAVKLNLMFNTNNFQVMHLSPKDNNLFYGTAYTKGSVAINGSLPSNISIKVNVEALEGTTFNLPIDNSSSVGSDALVTFLSHTSTKHANRKEKENGTEFSFEMDLTVTPTTSVSVLLGETSGGTITAQGNGALQLRLNPAGTFTIYGVYNITQGRYNMSIPGVKKTFMINPGSFVRFTGDPYLAIMDVNASYLSRANLQTLYSDARINDASVNSSQRIEVNTVVNLTGTIADMNYTFSINFPQNESLYQNTFGSYFGNYDNVEKQALGLLATDNFTSSDFSNTGGTGVALASSALSGLVSSKMSEALNEAIGVQNLDITASVSGNGATEVGGNIRLLNQRLIINGSVMSGGYGGGASGGNSNSNGTSSGSGSGNVYGTTPSATVSGDIDVQYLIFPDGTLRLKVYNYANATNTTDITYNSDYTQGVGVLYRKDFDTWKEFFKNDTKKSKQERAQKREQRKVNRINK